MTPEQPTSVPPGWYPDPHGVAELRWWDGADWTDHLHNTEASAETAPTAVEEAAVTAPAIADPITVQAVQAAPAEQDNVEQDNVEQDNVEPVNAVQSAVDPALNFPPPAYDPPGQVEDNFGTPVFDLDYEPARAAAQFSQPSVSHETPIPQEQPAPQELPVQQELPVEQQPATTPDFVPETPSPMHDLFSAVTPTEETAPGVAWQATSPPTTPEPVVAEPAPATDPNRLPSRRELRERGETFTEPAPVHAEPIPAVPVYEAPVPLTPDYDAPVLDLAAQPGAPTVTPEQPAAAFDTSVPTSFDWTADAPLAPSEPESTAGPEFEGSEHAPHSSAPAFSALPTPDTVAVEPAAAAWAPQDVPSVLPAIETPLPTLRSSTISGWLIAFMPLIAGLLSVGAVKGAENYPRYAPTGVSWWMLVVGVLVILYLVTVVLAIADRRRLDSFGHGAPAHWAWAFATAPVYLIMRMFAIMRETGRMTSQLWVWIILTLALVGGYLAATYFAPDLVSAYTLPFL